MSGSYIYILHTCPLKLPMLEALYSRFYYYLTVQEHQGTIKVTKVTFERTCENSGQEQRLGKGGRGEPENTSPHLAPRCNHPRVCDRLPKSLLYLRSTHNYFHNFLHKYSLFKTLNLIPLFVMSFK